MRNLQIITMLVCLSMPAFGQSASTSFDANVSIASVGPEGGIVTFVAVDPQNSSTVYAATAVGVFKSTDRGTSWRNAGLTGFSVSLMIDPQNPATLYASSVQGPYANYLFKSIDGGATWNELQPLAAGTCCLNAVAIDPQNPATLYAAFGTGGLYNGAGGVLKSSDGAATWQVAGSGLPDKSIIYDLAVDPQDPNVVYAAGYDRVNPGFVIFKTADGAASWTELVSGLPGGGLVSRGLMIDPQNPSVVYITTSSGGVFKSTDGGMSWNAMNSGLPVYRDSQNARCCRTALALDPQNSSTLYVATDDGIFKSTNGGETWSAVYAGSGVYGFGVYVYSLTVDPQLSNTLYAATFGSVFKSTDGGATWIESNSGLRAKPVLSVAIDPQRPSTLYAGMDLFGALKSTDGGKSWDSAGSGIKLQVGADAVVTLAIDPQSPSNVYAGTASDSYPGSGRDGCGYGEGGAFKSADAGMNWLDTGLVSCLSSIVIDPQNPNVIYGATLYSGVVKSTDGMASWTAVNSGLPNSNPFGGPFVTALAIDPQNPGKLYAGIGSTVFDTVDGGINWHANPLDATGFISAIAIDPANSATVYAASATYGRLDGRVLKSMDSGATWRNILSATDVYAVALNPQNGNTIYAGTDAGVVESQDGGENWTLITPGIGLIGVLVLDPQNPSILYAGGPAGLFAITLKRFMLSQK